jgi:hypothetical protein
MNLFRPVFAALLLTLSLNVFATTVGSVADVRFSTTGVAGWTLDGTEMVTTRAKLLELANFGPGGTVADAISIDDIAGEITENVLSGLDVFFVGYFDEGNINDFSVSEIAALQDWVMGGGVIILTCDNPSYDQLCDAFGHPSASSGGSSPVVVEASALGHPLFDGPFGTISSFQSAGDIGYFASANGATILARESSVDTYPQIMERASGSGLVLLVGDVDTMSDFGGHLSAGTGISTDNDIWLGNLFAYAADQSNVAPPAAVPVFGSAGMLALLLALMLTGFIAMRRSTIS